MTLEEWQVVKEIVGIVCGAGVTSLVLIGVYKLAKDV